MKDSALISLNVFWGAASGIIVGTMLLFGIGTYAILHDKKSLIFSLIIFLFVFWIINKDWKRKEVVNNVG